MWFQKVNNYPAQFDGFSFGGSFWVYEPDEPPASGGGGGKVGGMVAGGGSRGGAGSRSNQGSANASTPNSQKPSPAQLLAAKEKQKEAQKKKDQLKKELDAEKERKKKAEEAQFTGREGKLGGGTYMGGTFTPIVGATIEVGFVVDSKGQVYNYLSMGIAVGVEISAAGGVIVVPQKNFNAENWFGEGFGYAINIPFTPFSFEYNQSMYNTKYRAGKVGAGVGLGGSMNCSYTIITPVVPPELWSRPGQPR